MSLRSVKPRSEQDTTPVTLTFQRHDILRILDCLQSAEAEIGDQLADLESRDRQGKSAGVFRASDLREERNEIRRALVPIYDLLDHETRERNEIETRNAKLTGSNPVDAVLGLSAGLAEFQKKWTIGALLDRKNAGGLK